jgi:hypothetical protein
VLGDFADRQDLVECLKASANVPQIVGGPRSHRGHQLVDAAVFEPLPVKAALRCVFEGGREVIAGVCACCPSGHHTGTHLRCSPPRLWLHAQGWVHARAGAVQPPARHRAGVEQVPIAPRQGSAQVRV